MPPTNPLFPSSDDQPHDRGYVLPPKNDPVAPAGGGSTPGANPAADLIRKKLDAIYAEAPDTEAEEREARAVPRRSKHQQYMYDLTTSGKSLAEIQAAWHTYYGQLPDAEKREVWREFYQASGITVAAGQAHSEPAPQPAAKPTAVQQAPVASASATAPAALSAAATPQPTAAAIEPVWPSATYAPQQQPAPTAAILRQRIRDKVTAGGRLQAKHHVQSLLFGLAVGGITVVIFLFGFFNEVVIAPFIQPGRAGATPIIIDPKAITASSKPEIIIPKINLEIPVDFSQTSTDEATIENALENGIVHYPTTVMPGQKGNAAFFGHSSNNIFNPGKYKFAFVLLHELVPGDTFYISYRGQVYVYKVFSKKVVDPSDVGVLDNISGHTATATLITCDPPGTSLHRLVVVGDQISPDPSGNHAGHNTTDAAVTSSQLPGNGPSLWSRIWNSIF